MREGPIALKPQSFGNMGAAPVAGTQIPGLIAVVVVKDLSMLGGKEFNPVCYQVSRNFGVDEGGCLCTYRFNTIPLFPALFCDFVMASSL